MMFLATEILIQVIRYLFLKLICGLQNVTNETNYKKKLYKHIHWRKFSN